MCQIIKNIFHVDVISLQNKVVLIMLSDKSKVLIECINKTSLCLCDIGADAVLEIPELILFEGDYVTLRCKNQTTRRAMTATFFKDGSPLQMDTTHWSSTTGELTVRVSVSDEGRYKCQFADGTESEERELRVKGKKLSHCDDKTLLLF